MKTHRLSALISMFILLAACAPTATSTPTAILTPTLTPTETASPQITPDVGEIVSSVQASIFPQRIHVGQGALWYWFEDCACVIRFDPVSGKEVASIKIGDGKAGTYGNPKDMAVDGKAVWVTDAGHHAVVRIDSDTNQIAEQIPLEFTDAVGKIEQVIPFGLAIDGTTLWVSDFDQNVVVRVDTETKKIIAVIPNIPNPEGIAVSSGAVWVVEHRVGAIARIDPATNTVVATITIPAPAGLGGKCGMCIDYVIATEDAVWVPLDRGMGVARIDPRSNEVSAVIPLEFQTRNIAVSDNAIWVAGSLVESCAHSPGGIARIDPQTNTVVETLSIPCAFSVGVYQGDVWVGAGDPIVADSPKSMTQIKPGQ